MTLRVLILLAAIISMINNPDGAAAADTEKPQY